VQPLPEGATAVTVTPVPVFEIEVVVRLAQFPLFRVMGHEQVAVTVRGPF